MFQIDVKSRKAIYEQVADYFKELIIAGVMKAGEKAPSVRELSKQLTINPNTIQKAYKELERTGYFYSMAGLGSFVADRKNEEANPKKVRELKDSLTAIISELIYLGCAENEIREAVERGLVPQSGSADSKKGGENK